MLWLNKIFILKLHPQMIGRASRAAMLGDLISYMKAQGAWITTCEEAARYVLAQYSGSVPASDAQRKETSL